MANIPKPWKNIQQAMTTKVHPVATSKLLFTYKGDPHTGKLCNLNGNSKHPTPKSKDKTKSKDGACKFTLIAHKAQPWIQIAK